MIKENEFQNAALLLVGHGSTKNRDSVLPVEYQANRLRQTGLFGAVYEAFWKVEPKIENVLDRISLSPVYIVPFFLSEGYFTQEVLPQHLGLSHGRGVWRGVWRGKELLYCRPVGVHPKINEIVDQRIQDVLVSETCPDPAQTCLFIAGHGTNQNANSSLFIERQVERVAETGQFAQVKAIYLDQEPAIANWREWTNLKQIAVIPYFLSDGLHVAEDIPELLGFQTGSAGEAMNSTSVDEFKQNNVINPDFNEISSGKNLFQGKKLLVADVEDRRIWYTRALGHDPAMAGIIFDVCREKAGYSNK